ncbi:MAG: hypothetical protein ACXAEN_26815 [Candidatus Thorarchaeota archaeon]|jgi:hypothetical protein
MTENIEQRARDMGWRPKEEWSGPEENWKTAEDFVRIGENYMPVLKERLGKMEETIGELRTENKKVTGSLTKLAEWHRGTWKRQYAKALADIKAQKRAAVAEHDTEEYDRLVQEEADLLDEADGSDPGSPPADDTVPEFYEFQTKNPWYGQDPEMTMYADGLQAVLTQYEGVSDDKTFFQEVEKRVRTRFPEKFRNDNQALPVAVEAGGGVTDGGKIEKGWGDIPVEHRAAYTENFTDIMTREEYAKEYWLQEGV